MAQVRTSVQALKRPTGTDSTRHVLLVITEVNDCACADRIASSPSMQGPERVPSLTLT